MRVAIFRTQPRIGSSPNFTNLLSFCLLALFVFQAKLNLFFRWLDFSFHQHQMIVARVVYFQLLVKFCRLSFNLIFLDLKWTFSKFNKVPSPFDHPCGRRVVTATCLIIADEHTINQLLGRFLVCNFYFFIVATYFTRIHYLPVTQRIEFPLPNFNFLPRLIVTSYDS